MPNRRKKTYATQKEEQDERRALENATAQAAMQPKVVESERNVEIQATSKVGNAEAEVILAKGQSTAEAYRLEVEAMGKDVFWPDPRSRKNHLGIAQAHSRK